MEKYIPIKPIDEAEEVVDIVIYITSDMASSQPAPSLSLLVK